MTLGHRIEPITYDLNAKCLVSLDVDDRPPPIMKLAHAQHHTQLLATFFYGQPIQAYYCKCNEIACHIGDAH